MQVVQGVEKLCLPTWICGEGLLDQNEYTCRRKEMHTM